MCLPDFGFFPLSCKVPEMFCASNRYGILNWRQCIYGSVNEDENRRQE